MYKDFPIMALLMFLYSISGYVVCFVIFGAKPLAMFFEEKHKISMKSVENAVSVLSLLFGAALSIFAYMHTKNSPFARLHGFSFLVCIAVLLLYAAAIFAGRKYAENTKANIVRVVICMFALAALCAFSMLNYTIPTFGM